jgi:DNA-binding protein HU-beta
MISPKDLSNFVDPGHLRLDSGLSTHSQWWGSREMQIKLEVFGMNKTEMAQKLAKKAGLSQGDAAEILDIIFSAHPRKGLIAIALDAGDKVTLPGFGTFSTKHRGERQGRNPATGKTITIPAKNYVHFKPGKTLRERVEK